jgi:hypothetical protein
MAIFFSSIVVFENWISESPCRHSRMWMGGEISGFLPTVGCEAPHAGLGTKKVCLLLWCGAVALRLVLSASSLQGFLISSDQ